MNNPLFTRVPNGWTTGPLKRLLHVKSGDMLSAADETNEGYAVIGGNGARGHTDRANTRGPALVVGRVGARCGNVHLIEEDFWASEHAFVVYPRQPFHLRYGRYLLEALDLNQYAIKTAQPLINTEIVEGTRAAFPSFDHQEAIANFLDWETSRLDGLLASKEQVLLLLAEKRKALITRAITRGLDPLAPIRHSGINWLREVPTHWETERGRWLFTERDKRSETGEEELLTVSHLTGVTPRSEKNVNMFEAETTEGYKIALAGDLVINTLWAWMGAMGVSRVNGIVSPAYHVYRLGERLEPNYVDAMVRLPIFAQEVTRYSKGVWSSRLRLYPEGFFEVFLPVPPRAEQCQIVSYVVRETAKLDEMCAATERTIALLKERRSALITAAVTGQINFKSAA